MSERTELINEGDHCEEHEGSPVPPSPDVRRRHKEQESPARPTEEKVQTDDEDVLCKVKSFSSSPAHKSTPSPLEKTFQQMIREDELKKSKKETGPNPVSSNPTPTILNKTQKSSLNFCDLKNVVCISLLIPLLVLGIWAFVGSGLDFNLNKTNNVTVVQNIQHWNVSRKFLFNKIKSLKNNFVGQKEETWIQILAAVNSTFSDDQPKQPAAIVVLVPPAVSREFATCFVKTLAKTVNDAYMKSTNKSLKTKRLSVIKEVDVQYFAKSETVTQIHDDLKKYLHQDKAVIFYDVDRIKREDHLLVFHGFCDSSQAYDKRATYFFVISVPKEIHQANDWTHFEGENIAQQILDTAWDTLSADKRPAIISRVLANIILVNEGDSCQFNI